MDLGRRPFVLFVMVAIAAVVEAAWLAPASLVDTRIARSTRGAMRLTGAEGTLWNGRGTVATINGSFPVAWDLELSALLQGEARIRMWSDLGSNSSRGTVAIRANGITLRDTDLALPAAVIGTVLGDGGVGSVRGVVTASTRELHFAPGSNRGEAHVVWRAARIEGFGIPAPLDLGEVRSTVIANGATMSGPLTNDGGNLSLRGEWTLQEKEGLSLALRVAPRRADQADLTRWLSAIGTADGDGWRINWLVPLR